MSSEVDQLKKVWIEILSILSDDILRKTGILWTEHVTTEEQTILQNIVSNGDTEHILYVIQTIHKKIIESTNEKTGEILKTTIQTIINTKDISILLELSKYVLDILKGLQKFSVELRISEINLPKGILKDEEITGITRKEIEQLRNTIHTWAAKQYTIEDPWKKGTSNTIGPFQGSLWLTGSTLFGFSPVKGILFKIRGKEKFFGPKPSDSTGISDVDIGLEVSEEFVEKNAPLHLLKISPTSKLQELSVLWSRALTREQITKEWAFHREPTKRLAGQWILKLFEEIEKITLRGLLLSTKNGRPVNIRFFIKNHEKEYWHYPRLRLY